MTRRALVAALALILPLAAACAPAASAPGPAPASDRDAIVRVLEESTLRWNEGDLDGFLLPYLDDAGTTYVGSRGVTRGKGGIADSYRASYFRAGAPLPGRLSFRDIEVRGLGDGFALALGRYVLADRATGAETATGMFSLVMRRTPDGWRIIHDHSS